MKYKLNKALLRRWFFTKEILKQEIRTNMTDIEETQILHWDKHFETKLHLKKINMSL